MPTSENYPLRIKKPNGFQICANNDRLKASVTYYFVISFKM